MLPHQSSPPSSKQPESPSRLASIIQPSSPRYPLPGGAGGGSPAAGHRRLGIAVDLSDESAYAVRWAVQNYIRHDDSVILLHVRPTSVLYGADWGFVDRTASGDGEGGDADEETQRKLEDDFDAFTMKKLTDLAQPLVEAKIAFKMHIVKDHDMKERLCLEVERLGLSAVIMGSRGFGAAKRSNKGRLGSVSDYCVHHCVCPVVVVRFPDEKDGGGGGGAGADVAAAEVAVVREAEVVLHSLPEDEQEGEQRKGEKVL